jgi:poly-gamma-glutamate synthesis protein (capsule biosynthesis protein)
MSNNHDCDTGVFGILDTLDNVKDYKFMRTGTFPNKDTRRYLLIEVNGIKIALMSFATHFNGKDKMITEEGRDVLLNKYSKKRLTEYVKLAKKAGAEFIVAYNHWGDEYTYDVNDKQIEYAQEMADCGVDYIIGSHTHCLQHYDILTSEDGRKVPVVYSMGNFLSDMSPKITKDTIYLDLKLKRNKKGKVVIANEEFMPCYIYRSYRNIDYPIVPQIKANTNSSNVDTFKERRSRVKEIMGDKIRMADFS